MAIGEEIIKKLLAGYEKYDPAGRGSGNSRNGFSEKTIQTEDGALELDVPRDRNGTFGPDIVPKGQTRLDGLDNKIISLYARGMSVRDIQGHLQELYGIEVPPDLISRVTDAVTEEVREWQTRPLDAVYPVIFSTLCVSKSATMDWSRTRWFTWRWPSPIRASVKSGLVGRTDRRCQVLDESHVGTAESRRPGRLDRRRRWIEGLPGSDYGHLSAGHRSNVHCPHGPIFLGFLLLEGPKNGCCQAVPCLPGRDG